MKSYLPIFLFVFLFASCSSENKTTFTPQTEADIIKYISNNNLNAEKSSSGVCTTLLIMKELEQDQQVRLM